MNIYLFLPILLQGVIGHPHPNCPNATNNPKTESPLSTTVVTENQRKMENAETTTFENQPPTPETTFFESDLFSTTIGTENSRKMENPETTTFENPPPTPETTFFESGLFSTTIGTDSARETENPETATIENRPATAGETTFFESDLFSTTIGTENPVKMEQIETTTFENQPPTAETSFFESNLFSTTAGIEKPGIYRISTTVDSNIVTTLPNGETTQNPRFRIYTTPYDANRNFPTTNEQWSTTTEDPASSPGFATLPRFETTQFPTRLTTKSHGNTGEDVLTSTVPTSGTFSPFPDFVTTTYRPETFFTVDDVIIDSSTISPTHDYFTSPTTIDSGHNIPEIATTPATEDLTKNLGISENSEFSTTPTETSENPEVSTITWSPFSKLKDTGKKLKIILDDKFNFKPLMNLPDVRSATGESEAAENQGDFASRLQASGNFELTRLSDSPLPEQPCSDCIYMSVDTGQNRTADAQAYVRLPQGARVPVSQGIGMDENGAISLKSPNFASIVPLIEAILDSHLPAENTPSGSPSTDHPVVGMLWPYDPSVRANANLLDLVSRASGDLISAGARVVSVPAPEAADIRDLIGQLNQLTRCQMERGRRSRVKRTSPLVVIPNCPEPGSFRQARQSLAKEVELLLRTSPPETPTLDILARVEVDSIRLSNIAGLAGYPFTSLPLGMLDGEGVTMTLLSRPDGFGKLVDLSRRFEEKLANEPQVNEFKS